MRKPTPAQAIMIKLMTGYPNISASKLWDNRIRSAGAYRFKPQFKQVKLNIATFRSLVAKGWVAKKADGRADDYAMTESGQSVLASLSPEDFIPAKPKWTAADIKERLRDRYPPPEWALIPELRIGTSYGRLVEKRIDAWAINCWRSQKFLKISFEIKVSRSDFLRELKDPKKRLPAMSVSNEFYFVAPKGIIKKEELPDDCGLIELLDSGSLRLAVRAETRQITDPPWSFVASIGRRSQAELEKQESVP